MLIEHLNPAKCKDNAFFSQQFVKKLNLTHVSMIATDLESFFIQGSPREQGVEHNVRIYGRCAEPYLDKIGDSAYDSNQVVEFAGLAPLRKAP